MTDCQFVSVETNSTDQPLHPVSLSADLAHHLSSRSLKSGQKLKHLEQTKGVILGESIPNNLSPNNYCRKSQFMPMYFHVRISCSPPENFGMLVPVLRVSQANVGSLPPVRQTSMRRRSRRILHFHLDQQYGSITVPVLYSNKSHRLLVWR